MNVDADVDLFCSKCEGYIQNAADIVCKHCAEDDGDLNEVLDALKPYVNEAVLSKSVTIPGDVAVKIMNTIRRLNK